MLYLTREGNGMATVDILPSGERTSTVSLTLGSLSFSPASTSPCDSLPPASEGEEGEMAVNGP